MSPRKAEKMPQFPELPKHKSRVDPNGYRIMSVRMREAEYVAFTREAEAIGLTNSLALRIAARRISGFLEIDTQTRDILIEIVDAIGDVSHALADLNSAYRQSGKVDMENFATQRAAFAKEFLLLDIKLTQILNVSHRRLDGRMLLKNALNAQLPLSVE